MLIGNFDLAIIGFLLLINYLIWEKRIKTMIGCLMGIVIFGLIIPLVSQIIEVRRVASEREILDNFTLLYTYLKFPIYWTIGVLQIIIYSRKKED